MRTEAPLRKGLFLSATVAFSVLSLMPSICKMLRKYMLSIFHGTVLWGHGDKGIGFLPQKELTGQPEKFRNATQVPAAANEQEPW